MRRRKRLSRRFSRRNFARTARKVHKRNLYRRSGRGGFRF